MTPVLGNLFDWRHAALLWTRGHVHNMGALELIGRLPDASVGMTLLDPPGNWGVRNSNDDIMTSAEPGMTIEDDHLSVLTSLAAYVSRVTKTGGSVIFLGDTLNVGPWKMAAAWAGLRLVSDIILLWSTRDRWRRKAISDIASSSMTITWHVRPGHRQTINPDRMRRIESNVIVTEPVPMDVRRAPTQKPVQLYNWLISNMSAPNDMIIDPFCGTGSGLVAAQMNNRTWVGCDVDDAMCTISRKRIADIEEAYLRPLYMWVDGELVKVEG